MPDSLSRKFRCARFLASLRDAVIIFHRFSGGVATSLLNHRLKSGKPPACKANEHFKQKGTVAKFATVRTERTRQG
jgi:hypothetical protein